MGISPGFAQWKLAYGISPIIFVGGIAANMPGGQMPIISITDAAAFAAGPIAQIEASVSVQIGGVSIGASVGASIGDDQGDPGLDGYFASYEPLPGGTLEDFEYGRYPFANQSVAANAVIQEPLAVSLLMICPVKGDQTWQEHLSTITALQSAMSQHAALGGSYSVATPKFPYTNGLLTKFADVTAGEGLQPQSRWQLDFFFPLITLQQAQAAQNGLMSKLTSGTQLPGSVGGATAALQSVVGALPAGLSPGGAVQLLNSGISSFNAGALISTVLPAGGTMASALSSLATVLPASLSPSAALLVLSNVVPAGISPAQIPGLIAQLAPAGIGAENAMALLSGALPGGLSPAAALAALNGSLPAGISVSAGLSFLAGANTGPVSISLSGGASLLGQPLTQATPPTVPAAQSLPGAGVPTASAGAFASISTPFGSAGISVSAST
jgi:hypothetical protein